LRKEKGACMIGVPDHRSGLFVCRVGQFNTLFSQISSHPAILFSHNKSVNSTFSHNKPVKRTGCKTRSVEAHEYVRPVRVRTYYGSLAGIRVIQLHQALFRFSNSLSNFTIKKKILHHIKITAHAWSTKCR
jgi:hypothetical protein